MSTTHQLSRRPVELGQAPAQVVSAWLRAATATVAAWLRHRRERRALAGLDGQMLQDLGLTRGDVVREYDQPFWRPVDYGALEAARRRSGPRLGRR
jgi:uncharacterized protein YjiS (DUF1127 family)